MMMMIMMMMMMMIIIIIIIAIFGTAHIPRKILMYKYTTFNMGKKNYMYPP